MNLRGRNKVSAEFNMSSMTDIVFFVTDFLMLTSTMVTTNALMVRKGKKKGKHTRISPLASIKKLEFFIDKETCSRD
jgi:biopolymer transport protein ExbD